MNSLQVNIPGREYEIDIGLEILEKCLPEAVQRNATDHVVVVTNTTLQEIYPHYISKVLRGNGIRISTCILPSKTS